MKTTFRGDGPQPPLVPLEPAPPGPRAALLGSPAVPRPEAVDLDLEREAEQYPDHHDEPEHPDALEGAIHDDRQDDVGDDEDLDAEQDRPAQVAAEPRVPVGVGLDAVPCVPHEPVQASEDHDERADGLDDLDDPFHDLVVGGAQNDLVAGRDHDRHRYHPQGYESSGQ